MILLLIPSAKSDNKEEDNETKTLIVKSILRRFSIGLYYQKCNLLHSAIQKRKGTKIK